MTLTSVLTKLSFSGNGSTTAFAVSFVFYDDDGLRVILVNSSGDETVQTITTQYTLSGGSGATGTLTMLTAPASGETLIIKSDIDDTQETDFPTGGNLRSTSIEQQMDILTRLVQQKEEQISRMMILKESTTLSDLTFPDPVAMASIRWNLTGDALESFVGSSNDSTFLQSGTGAVSRLVSSKIGEIISVKDFGATGIGVTDDTVAIQTTITAATASGATVFFPPGRYLTTGVTADSRIAIFAKEGTATLIGGLTYDETDFTKSADTTTPVIDTANFFYSDGLDYENSSGYGLSLIADESTVFEQQNSVQNASFYGQKGLRIVHNFSNSYKNLRFFTTVEGAKSESSTNILWENCKFHNQAFVGLYITTASSTATRAGGELHKIVNCEFAVCSTGIYGDTTRWLTIENTLIDFCGAAIYLRGCRDYKFTNSYFSTSNTYLNLSGVSGFTAPVVTERSLYGEPQIFDGSDFNCGGSAVNCVFASTITGGTNTMVEFDKKSFSGFAINQAQFIGCTFFTPKDHDMVQLLLLTGATNVNIIGNNFRALINASATITAAYALSGSDTPFIHASGNLTKDVLSNGSAIDLPSHEQPDFRNLGVVNNTSLKFQNASGIAVSGIIVNPNNIFIFRTITDSSVIRFLNQSNTKLFEVDQNSISFGVHTAISAETVTGFITVKDIAGNTRKVAVVS